MGRPNARLEERVSARMDEIASCKRCLAQMQCEEHALRVTCREFLKSEDIMNARINALCFQNECDTVPA